MTRRFRSSALIFHTSSTWLAVARITALNSEPNILDPAKILSQVTRVIYDFVFAVDL